MCWGVTKSQRLSLCSRAQDPLLLQPLLPGVRAPGSSHCSETPRTATREQPTLAAAEKARAVMETQHSQNNK